MQVRKIQLKNMTYRLGNSVKTGLRWAK